MFVGSNYVKRDTDNVRLHDDPALEPSMLGWDHIQIMERVLSRTVTRTRKAGDSVTSYYYTLHCLVSGDGHEDDSAEIPEEDLESEVISGIYVLAQRFRFGKGKRRD